MSLNFKTRARYFEWNYKEFFTKIIVSVKNPDLHTELKELTYLRKGLLDVVDEGEKRFKDVLITQTISSVMSNFYSTIEYEKAYNIEDVIFNCKIKLNKVICSKSSLIEDACYEVTLKEIPKIENNLTPQYLGNKLEVELIKDIEEKLENSFAELPLMMEYYNEGEIPPVVVEFTVMISENLSKASKVEIFKNRINVIDFFNYLHNVNYLLDRIIPNLKRREENKKILESFEYSNYRNYQSFIKELSSDGYLTSFEKQLELITKSLKVNYTSNQPFVRLDGDIIESGLVSYAQFNQIKKYYLDNPLILLNSLKKI